LGVDLKAGVEWITPRPPPKSTDAGICSAQVLVTNDGCVLRRRSFAESSIGTSDAGALTLHFSIGDDPEYLERLGCGEMGNPCGEPFVCSCRPGH
jgi:hypothetical protein